nr:UvrD-helicase domain-containing protein [Robbsia andropogonis]
MTHGPFIDADVPTDDGMPGDRMPGIVDPLSFPLRGSRLIEASAGTGKTFTIAALYLRLVLGLGTARALSPPEILVVTFTDAATKELRDRIRARLSEAAALFQAVATQWDSTTAGLHDGDVGVEDVEAAVQDAALRGDLLFRLLAMMPPDQWGAAAHKLRIAAEWMDEAAVSTIHGWCYRMLREHAFDSDSLFAQRLETDQRDLLAEVIRDYWRTFLYPVDDAGAAAILGWWSGPDDPPTGPLLGKPSLYAQVTRLLAHVGVLPPGEIPVDAIATARAAAQVRFDALRAPWAAWVDELAVLLDDACAAKRVDGRKIQARYYKPWLEILRNWAAQEAPAPLLLPDAAWNRLSEAGLAEGWKVGEPPDHPALSALPLLRQALAALPDARDTILRHAVHWVAGRFALEQERRAQMGFDDLLRRLDAALQGNNGQRLAALIRRQFPVAMIDEFQDTDPLQYRIFDAVYRVRGADTDAGSEAELECAVEGSRDEDGSAHASSNGAVEADAVPSGAPVHALILIGDPKQAIYAFRGADIHTYLLAREATAGRHYTLGTNYRSTLSMVAAVNHCFEQAEIRPEGRGAFLFRAATDVLAAHAGVTRNPLPFLPVDASGRNRAWWVDGERSAALTAWWTDSDNGIALPRNAYQHRFAHACAAHIVHLLALGKQHRAGFRDASGHVTPVQPADIAILVNTGAEARAIKQALQARGIRSVYLSDRESVFASEAADDVQRWLAACATPDDDRLLRTALASPILGLDWSDLDRLNSDEAVWEAHVTQFREYRRSWQRQGVLPMLHRLLHDFGVPGRLLAANLERALTDVLHLAELLQQASSVLDGEHALIRHLAEQRRDAGSQDDARKLRLESDAERVKVVTVHKSKGLEYPLVFLPFASAYRAVKDSDVPLIWHDARHQTHVRLRGDADAVRRVDDERLGEDLRKLYVALTRAQYATWIGVAPLADLHRGALGYLLHGGQPIPPGDIAAVLERFRGGCGDIAVTALPTTDVTSSLDDRADVALHVAEAAHADGQELAALAPERAPPAVPRETWWIASYTALAAMAQGSRVQMAPPLESAHEALYAEEVDDAFFATSDELGTDALNTSPPSPLDAMHAFPRGPGPGSFLHGLLEWAGEEGFDRVVTGDSLRDEIARRCQVRGWDVWIAPLTQWLQDWLATPLPLPIAVGKPVEGDVGDAVDEESTHRDSPAATLKSAERVSTVSYGPSLADLHGYQVEMEFWFSLHDVSAPLLDQIVRRHTPEDAPRARLTPHHMNGMLKGFIDLVFEYQGRYYVVDYKSNWLGDDARAYTRQAMAEAVAAKRYDLQYALYVFALHRLLRARLPDYDYDTHVGGALYLFLRGGRAATHGVYHACLPRAMIDEMEALFTASPSQVQDVAGAPTDFDGMSEGGR